MLRRLRRAASLARLSRSAGRTYLSALLRRRCSHVALRSGLVFDAPRNANLLDLVADIFQKRRYEPEGIAIRPDDVVVDIGANVGVFSIDAAQRTRGPVYALEPFPENFEFLVRNVRQNRASGVVPMNRAVSGSRGTTKLFISDSSGGHLLFDHNIRGKLDRSIEVPTLGLADLFDDCGIGEIGLLKLDCEGSEGSILKCAGQDRLRRVRQLAMEFHDNVSELDHRQIAALLQDAGFRVWCESAGQSPFGYLWAVRH